MRRRLLFLVFFMVLTSLSAQQNLIDSLEAHLPHSSDLKKIDILNDISKAYWAISLEKSKEYAKQALDLAEKIRSRKGMADAYNRLGNVEHYIINSENALDYYRRSLDIRLDIEDYKGIISSYNNLAVVYNVLGNNDKTLEYYLKALEISKQITDQLEIAKYLLSVGRTYTEMHNSPKALEYINFAKENYEKLNHLPGIAGVNKEMGNIYYDLMDFNCALEYYINSFLIYEKISDTRGMASNNNNIGSVYWKLGKNDLALEYHLKALNLYQKIPEDKLGNASTLNNIGITYHNKGDLSKALEYYNQVLEIYLEIKSESGLAVVYHNIGMLYTQMKEYDKALKSYFKSVDINKKRKSDFSLANNYNNIGELYLLKKEYSTAIETLKKSISLASKINAREVLMENYLFQSRTYSEMNNFPKALALHKLYTLYKDSIFNLDNQNKIIELQVRFEAEAKSKEIDLLLKDNQLQENKLERQRNERYFFLVLTLLIIILVFFVHNRYRLKLKLNSSLIEKNKQLEEINTRLNLSEQNLLKINATKDKFFSIIAHDLKNPFNALLSFSSMLHENLKAFKKAEIRAYVEIIHKATNNLFRLLENLLQWSFSQTGKIEYRPEIIDLNNLVNNILQIMSIQADKKGINIVNLLPDSFNAYGDNNLISTVIRNLISNAVKFTRENGEIRIEGIIKTNEIEIAIVDNGIGINHIDISKLFRLDCNVTTIGTSEEKGTGLGLILCKEFVEKNGGRIWVESEIEKGSTFKFTIPKNKKAGG